MKNGDQDTTGMAGLMGMQAVARHSTVEGPRVALVPV